MALLPLFVGFVLTLMAVTYGIAPSLAAGFGGLIYVAVGVYVLRTRGGFRRPAALAFALAGLACLAPEGFRRAGGAGYNLAFRPAAFGPGDTVRVGFPRWIRSVRGLWKGAAQARLVAGDGAVVPVPARTSDRRWGDKIRLHRDRTGSTQKSRAFVELDLPKAPGFSGRAARVEVELAIEFPRARDGGFALATDSFRRDEAVTLGPPGLGAAYLGLCYFGVVAGALLTAAGCRLAPALESGPGA